MQDLKERMKNRLENLKQKNKEEVDSKLEKEDSLRRLERSRSPRTDLPSTNRQRLELDEETTWDEFSFGTQVDPTERDNGYDSVNSYESRGLRSQRRRELLKKKEDMELKMQDLSRRYRSEATLDVKKEPADGYNSTAEFNLHQDRLQKMEDFEGSFKANNLEELKKKLPRSQSEPQEIGETLRSYKYEENEIVLEEEFEDSDFENSKEDQQSKMVNTCRSLKIPPISNSSRMRSKYTSNIYNEIPLPENPRINNRYNRSGSQNSRNSSTSNRSIEKKNFKKKSSGNILKEKNHTSRERTLSRGKKNSRASYHSVQNLKNLITENRSRASLISDKENSTRIVNRKSEIIEEEEDEPYSRELLLLSRKLEETDKEALESFKKLSEKYEKLINEYVPYTEEEDLMLGDQLSEEIGTIASKCIKKKRSKFFCLS